VHATFSLRIPDIEKCISENSQIVDRFQDLMKSYLIGGKSSAAERYILEDLYNTPALILRRSMELFIMGHEYSHILAGHLDHRQIVPRSLVEHQVNEIKYLWEQEHQADILGSSLAILAMKRYEKVDFAFSYWGADIFFTALDTIEKGKIILSTGEKNYIYQIEEHSSHPPPLSRRGMLRL
jgi:hypothetical protein